MKMLKLIPAVLFLFLISCSDDDGNTSENTTPVDQATLIGTWEMTSLTVDADLTGQLLGIPLVTNTTSVGENFDYTLTFTETTYSTAGSYDIVTTGTANGIPLDEERETITDANDRGTYELVNGQIILDGDLLDASDVSSDLEGVEVDPNFEIGINSDGDLVIEQSAEVTIDPNGDSPLDVVYDSRVVFRKQG